MHYAKEFHKCNPRFGGGNGTVTVTASQNTEDERTESITISGSGVTKTISIHQEAIQQTVKVTEFTKNHFWWTDSPAGTVVPVPGSIDISVELEAGVTSGYITFDRKITNAEITDNYGHFDDIGLAHPYSVGFGSSHAVDGDYQTIEVSFEGFTGVLKLELSCRS